jgi:hypothetical protein
MMTDGNGSNGSFKATGMPISPPLTGSIGSTEHTRFVSSAPFVVPAASASRTFSTTIVDLGDDRVLLRTPLVVVVEEGEDEAVASWPEIEAFGSGCTTAEALNELKDEIVSVYHDLVAAPDAELGRLPLRWKRALSIAVAPRPERAL